MAMYQIECAYTCHTGNIRANNEDNFWCFGESLPVNNEGTKGICSKIISGNRAPAMAVFDGMGGESCGEIAAFLASEEFGKFYNANKRMLRDMPEDFIDDVCEKMNQAVCRYGIDHHIWSMGSTMAMLLFTPESMFACNLGDSRIYRSSCEKFGQISEDHTLGRHFLGKAPLTQYLGMQEEDLKLAPSLTRYPVAEGDRYLICSDGITDMLSDGEIADIFTREIPVEETVQVLVERALKKGGRDNITVILCEVMNQKENWWKRMWNQLKRHEGDVS